jgi:hypothetical protein
MKRCFEALTLFISTIGIIAFVFMLAIYYDFSGVSAIGMSGRLASLNGLPLAGPTNSDCQIYQYVTNVLAINCPLQFIPVTAESGVHVVQTSEWGSVLVASGGSMVQFQLPAGTRLGRNIVGFATDSNTGFSVSAAAGTTMQGSPGIVNGTLTAGPNASGMAGLSGTVWQVDIR